MATMTMTMTSSRDDLRLDEPDRLDQLIDLQIQTLELTQTVDAKLTVLLELMTPKDKEGPTLDDILARMVEMLGDQAPYLRRIDTTTGRTLDHLEGRPVRARPPETPLA